MNKYTALGHKLLSKNQPGQKSALHFSVFLEGPLHSLPPFSAFGCLLRIFVFSVWRQVHRDQNVHSPHLQSVGEVSVIEQ